MLLCPATLEAPSIPPLSCCRVALQAPGSDSAPEPLPTAAQPRRAFTLQAYCMLQIPNCPVQSNKDTAASKSLRYICPGRLQVAEARKLKGQNLRLLGQAAPMCMHGLMCAHVLRVPLQEQGFAHSGAPVRAQELMCLQSLCGLVLQKPFSLLLLCWDCRPCPKHPLSDHSCLRCGSWETVSWAK